MDYLKEFTAKIQSLDRSRSPYEVFKDFLTLSAYSLAQPFYRSEEIELKYKYISSKYTKEQAEEFPKLLAFLVSALEKRHQDFLGEVFMQMNLGNAVNGQYFTPYRVSKMMSKLTGIHVKKYANSEIMTLCEPCCGSGAMIIAFAECLLEQDINYQHCLYVEATDIDEMCYKMAYIQLSLLEILAKVIWGDSLSMRYNEVLYTPFFFLGDFQQKLEDREKTNKMKDMLSENTSTTQIVTGNQLKLFKFL